MSTFETIQKKWNSGNNIQVLKGENGLIKVQLNFKQSSLEVYLLGATITSYKVSGNRDIIFCSKKSKFEELKAIRGGIPLIFPQFGPGVGKMQQHGFARNINWEISFTSVTDSQVVLGLSSEDNEYSRKVAGEDFKFKSTLLITLLSDRLNLSFETKNTGDKEFDFQLALHTYYQVSDITKTSVKGLKGFEYIDKTRNLKLITETSDGIQITEETDRVYKNCTANPIELIDGGNQNKVSLLSSDQSFKDVVVWNPWIEKAKAMADFGDDEYKEMICIEYGNIEKLIILKPNESHIANHSIIPSLQSLL